MVSTLLSHSHIVIQRKSISKKFTKVGIMAEALQVNFQDAFDAQRQVDIKKENYRVKLEEFAKIITTFQDREKTIQDSILPQLVKQIRVKNLRLQYALVRANQAKLQVLTEALSGEDRVDNGNIEIFQEADKICWATN